jgi:hypothetical protein
MGKFSFTEQGFWRKHGVHVRGYFVGGIFAEQKNSIIFGFDDDNNKLTTP